MTWRRKEGKEVWNFHGGDAEEDQPQREAAELEEKNTKLEDRRVELAAALEETNMLSMKMYELHPDAAKIVHVVRARMLKHLAAEMKETDAAKKPMTEWWGRRHEQ